MTIKNRIPLYRFPVLFGGFLIASVVAFINRDYFLQGTEEKRQVLFKDDPEALVLIQNFKNRNQ